MKELTIGKKVIDTVTETIFIFHIKVITNLTVP